VTRKRLRVVEAARDYSDAEMATSIASAGVPHVPVAFVEYLQMLRSESLLEA
jgi:hypothetical protein